MTVAELRKCLEDVPGEMLVGAEDADGMVCEIQSAGITSDEFSGTQFFHIHPNGGYYLFEY
jgi:hypothetical protein